MQRHFFFLPRRGRQREMYFTARNAAKSCLLYFVKALKILSKRKRMLQLLIIVNFIIRYAGNLFARVPKSLCANYLTKIFSPISPTKILSSSNQYHVSNNPRLIS